MSAHHEHGHEHAHHHAHEHHGHGHHHHHDHDCCCSNPIANLAQDARSWDFSQLSDNAELTTFCELPPAGYFALISQLHLQLTVDDLMFCAYAFNREKRVPTPQMLRTISSAWAENPLRVTTWSGIAGLQIDDAIGRHAWERYLELRSQLDRNEEIPSLYDVATTAARSLGVEPAPVPQPAHPAAPSSNVPAELISSLGAPQLVSARIRTQREEEPTLYFMAYHTARAALEQTAPVSSGGSARLSNTLCVAFDTPGENPNAWGDILAALLGSMQAQLDCSVAIPQVDLQVRLHPTSPSPLTIKIDR